MAPWNTAELRIDATWVRRLAGALVRSSAAADDLAQDAWVAALEQRPDPNRPLEPWFASVMRNLARLRRRANHRAEAREKELLAPEPPPAADELLAKIETERELIDLVCGLDEPYRSVVLLRYHEGFSAEEIARQCKLPAGTVRWQLKTGLDRVRARLSERHGSEPAWAIALVHLARPGPIPHRAIDALQGALAMSMRMKAALVVSSLILIAGLLFWLSRSPSLDPQSAASPAAAANASTAPAELASAPPPKKTAARIPSPDAGAIAWKADAGTPLLFGPLVAMGQGFTLAEMLSKNAKNADDYVDKLCDAFGKLRTALPQSNPGNSADAAAFMDPLMDYEKQLDDPPGKLHLSPEFRAHIDSYHQDWPTLITDADLAGLDFSWLPALSQFDHWSVYGAGRLRNAPVGNIFQDTIPNYLSLMYWTKLRFALSLRTGDFVEAANEIDQLSMLTRSQNILMGTMIAIQMQRFEAIARNAFAAAGADVSGWTAPDLTALQDDRQMEFASVFFTYPGVSEATLRKAIACTPSPCTALVEGAGANKAIGAFVDSDNLDLINSLSLEKGCDQRPFARANASSRLSPLDALSSVMSETIGDEIPKRFATPVP